VFEAVLADRERVLGGSHPDTLITRHNLAFAYEAAGQLAKAIEYYQVALAGMERVLGAGHPHTVTARKNLERVRSEAAPG
jgi:tetratricopeptide repeat protein